MTRRRIVPSLIRFGRRVQARIFGTPVPQEVDEEFAFHVEMRIREYLAEGMTLEEARTIAVRRFGDIDEVKAICRKLGGQRERKMRWTMWIGELIQDLRFGLRQLRKNPGLSAVAVLTLGLGIGANTAVFSVINGVLLTPLPFPEPDRLVEVRTRYLPPSGFDLPRFPISNAEFLDYRNGSESYEALGLYQFGTRTLTDPGAEPQRVPAIFLNRQVLEALGVEPAIGRWFTEEEDQPDVATGLIGHDLWTSRYGADPEIVGRTIDMAGSSFLVTGVMPEDFAFPFRRYQVFENLGLDEANPGGRAGHGSVGIGRLRDGISFEQAEAEVRTIHAGWEEVFPHNVAHFPILEHFPENVVGLDVRRALMVVMGAVGVVLLIAIANVANLLMVRGEARQMEIAVRTSLGAARGRIVRQLLTESLILALLGAGLGVLIGTVGLQAILRMDPGALPRADLIGLDGGVLVFTATVTVLAAILFGLAPALGVAREPADALGSDGKSTSTGAQRSFRRWLVGAEVAMSVVVVAAAGLIGQSLRTLLEVDPGVEVEGRLTFALSPTGDSYPEPAARITFFETLQERLAALPGVTSVSAVTHLPLSGRISRSDFDIEGRTRAEGEPIWSGQWTGVLPGYFQTMGIRATAGRVLNETDRPGSEHVVVVGQDVVDEYFGGRNPIGERIGVSRDSVLWARIVGIVPRTRTNTLDGDQVPQVYYNFAQGPEFVWSAATLNMIVQTAVPPETLIPAARAAVTELDSSLPLMNLRTMEEVLNSSVARPRMIATLLGSFALIALVLAAIGIYGVVSYSVTRRTREIGIRMALGAERLGVARLMIREGAWPAIVGIAVGVPLAMGASGWLSGLLYETSPRDPAVFTVIPLVLLAVALLSSWLPARRATRLAPTEALRQD